MLSAIEPRLYIDPQDQPPAGYCEFCGGELYLPSLSCACQEGSA